MHREMLRRIAQLEANACAAEEVPWTQYSATFQLIEGESWDEMRSRARRWLNGEAVPGKYGIRKPQCCSALLFSYHDGNIKSERLTVDNPAYRPAPMDPRAAAIIKAKLQEWSDAS